MNKDKRIIIDGKRYHGSATVLTNEQAKENSLLMVLKGTDHFEYSDYEKEVFTHEVYEDIIRDGNNNMQSYVILKDFRHLYSEEELNDDREAFLKTQLDKIREDNSYIYLIQGEEQLKKALLLLLAKPKMKRFTLIKEDRTENKSYSEEYEYEDRVKDPEQALRDAIKDFLNTEEGLEAVADTCGYFNWGDASNVPEEILNKYGIYTVYNSNSIDIVVNHDEVLCD